MKKSVLFIFCLFLTWEFSTAQNFPGLDNSPMDMAYYPPNFAHDRIFDPDLIGDQEAVARIIYSRPQKEGREIFGGLVPFGEVWRTGANETTQIKFYKDVTIGEVRINAGTYSLFTIPGQNAWTIIINANQDYWGAYNYNADHDVVRTSVPVNQLSQTVEAFTIKFAWGEEGEAPLQMAWDKTMVEVPINY